MSKESQDQRSTKDNTIKVELQPRSNTQATAVAEGHDDTESLERPQVDICDGQAFQCSAPGRPRSLVQTSDQDSDTPGRDMGSTNQSLQVNPTGASLPAVVQLEAGAALATQRHGSENVAIENDRLSPNVERILLDAIRDGVLFMLGVTTKVAENILITNFGSRTMRFQFGVDIKEIVELSWEAVGETGKRNEDTRIEQALRSAWPKSRENEWIRQYLIESDGCSPAIKAPWSSLVEVYQDDINVFDRTVRQMCHWQWRLVTESL